MLAESRERNDDDDDDDNFIADLLLGTSRTFALAIPLLEPERRRQIGLSYLLFRVADSIEDAPTGSASEKKVLLGHLKTCLLLLRSGQPLSSAIPEDDSVLTAISAERLAGLWPESSPTSELLRGLPRLVSIFRQLPLPISEAVSSALMATIDGMTGFIDNSADLAHQIQIRSLTDLRLYCYAVAGIVGEMLTDIFVHHFPQGAASHAHLRQLAVGFGEFLQLINILKDSQLDASSGRLFIPAQADRDSVHDLAITARQNASSYIQMLEADQFPEDILRFCRFIYLLADGSFEKLRQSGAGSKLSRREVLAILTHVKSNRIFSPENSSGPDQQPAPELTL